MDPVGVGVGGGDLATASSIGKERQRGKTHKHANPASGFILQGALERV